MPESKKTRTTLYTAMNLLNDARRFDIGFHCTGLGSKYLEKLYSLLHGTTARLPIIAIDFAEICEFNITLWDYLSIARKLLYIAYS